MGDDPIGRVAGSDPEAHRVARYDGGRSRIEDNPDGTRSGDDPDRIRDDFPGGQGGGDLGRAGLQGVETRPFFYPVHTLSMYTEEAARASLPVAESLAARGINLPSGAGLTRDDVAYVGAAIRETLAR